MNVFTIVATRYSRVRATVHSTGVTHATSIDIPRITPSPATGAAPHTLLSLLGVLLAGSKDSILSVL